MAFQFLCPQGHLLQGDEAHMGLTTQCPHCGMTFIIPRIEMQPQVAPAPVYGSPYASAPEPQQQYFHDVTQPEPEPYHEPYQEAYQEPYHEGHQDTLPDSPEEHPEVLHIPCPNGHELETPLDMLGLEVLCPHCGVQFRLREEESVEYKHEQEILEHERGAFWFKVAIGAAVVILLGLVGMMIVITQGSAAS